MQQLQKDDKNLKRSHYSAKEENWLDKETHKKICGKLLRAHRKRGQSSSRDPANPEKQIKLPIWSGKVRLNDRIGAIRKEKGIAIASPSFITLQLRINALKTKEKLSLRGRSIFGGLQTTSKASQLVRRSLPQRPSLPETARRPSQKEIVWGSPRVTQDASVRVAKKIWVAEAGAWNFEQGQGIGWGRAIIWGKQRRGGEWGDCLEHWVAVEVAKLEETYFG